MYHLNKYVQVQKIKALVIIVASNDIK